MYYKNIQGWFDFQPLYSKIINEAQVNDTLIEIGCWLGKSTCYMAETIKQRNKQLQLYAIDTWEGSDEEYHRAYIKQIKGSDNLYQEFLNNMKLAGINDIVKPIRTTSQNAATLFENKSVFFVFLDADHKYECINNDIDAWLPKIKHGGYIGGHDYAPGIEQSEGVVKAVKDHFDNYSVTLTTWFKKVEY